MDEETAAKGRRTGVETMQANDILSMLGFGSKGAAAEKAHEWVDAGATLLDVRTPAEFAEGHVRGALNISVQSLGGRLGDVPGERVVVYCRSGGRSAAADVGEAGPEAPEVSRATQCAAVVQAGAVRHCCGGQRAGPASNAYRRRVASSRRSRDGRRC